MARFAASRPKVGRPILKTNKYAERATPTTFRQHRENRYLCAIDPVTSLRDFPSDSRYLIGVSGGRDSVALLHWLLARGYGRLIVCHLDHGLRVRASRADARFVKTLAARAGLPFESKAEDVQRRAARDRSSLETAARAARYEFFAEVSRRRRCPRIFLAHHADDLVETSLFNLLRGSALRGLGAMRARSVHRAGRTRLEILRPWLGVWRKEIDQYVRAHHLTFREDQTNRRMAATRNRIRHRIIPYLERQLGRPVRESIRRAAIIAADEEDWLASLIPGELAEGRALPVRQLRQQPVAWQRRLLVAWLSGQGVRGLDFETIERVRLLLEPGNRVAKTNLPGDRHARRRAQQIFLEASTRARRAKT